MRGLLKPLPERGKWRLPDRAAPLVSGCLLLALLVFAHAPLLGSALLARDYAGILRPAARPVAGAWAWTSIRMLGIPAPGASATALRFEQLLLLLLLALAASLLVARLFEPRLGAPTASRSGWMSALLLCLHAGVLATSADLGSRADLLGLMLATWAAALFLVGRQTHRDAVTSASLVLFLGAAFASSSGSWLVGLVAVAEFACVRRHRKRSLRLRTAATTLAVFGGAALLPGLTGLLQASSRVHAESLRDGHGLWTRLLPASPESHWSSAVLACGLLLLALAPAFQAARQAPRLWSGVALAWAVALMLALLVPGGQGSRWPALVVVCVGLGLTVSSGGPRGRRGRVAALAVGFALLGHLEARPIPSKAAGHGELQAGIAPLVRGVGEPLWVIDPPAGVGRELAWLFHPRVTGEEGRAFSEEGVRAVSARAFLTLASTEALAPWREQGVRVIARAHEVGRSSAGWVSCRLAPRARTIPESLTWKTLTYELPDPIDPMDWEFARFVADLASAPAHLDRLGWDGVETRGSHPGFVTESAGRRVAEFDLSRSLAWRLAGAVQGLRVERGVRGIERAELARRLPAIVAAGAPIPSGDDWVFSAPLEAGAGGRFELSAVALDDLEQGDFPCHLGVEGLRASGVEAFRRCRSFAPLAWVLDYRIGSRVVQRTCGTFSASP